AHHAPVVPRAEGDKRLAQPFHHTVGDVPHHPEVHKHDVEWAARVVRRAVVHRLDGGVWQRVDEQVAGVRVGVEEAEVEDHLQVEVEQAACGNSAIHACRVNRGVVCDLDAGHVLHGEHTPRRVLRVDAGNVHAQVIREKLLKALGVAGLCFVIDLLPQRAGELLQQGGDIRAATDDL